MVEEAGIAESSGEAPGKGPIVGEPVLDTGIKIYQFSIEKLSEENARYWFHRIESQLRAQFCWQAIECYKRIGSAQYSEVLRTNGNWYKVDLKANLIIEQGLAPSTILETKSQPNAASKWDYLQGKFLRSSNTMKALKLMEITSWSMNPTMRSQEALQELRQLGDEFIDMNGGKTIDIDDLIVLCYLKGLVDKFSTVRDAVMSTGEKLDLPYVQSRIEDVERMWNKPIEKGSRARAETKKKKSSSRCFVCGKIGHFAKDCPDKKGDDDEDHQPDRRRGRSKQKQKIRATNQQKGRIAESYDDDDQELSEFGAFAAEDYRDKLLDESGGFAIEEYAGFARDKAQLGKDCSPERWCFDSGATSMTTGCREIFERFDCQWVGMLTIASGIRMPIRGRGIVRFELNGQTVRLANVIYVPGLAENLLSLEALHIAGYESRGSSKGYELLWKGKVIAKGRRVGRSTYLDWVDNTDALMVSPKKLGRQAAASRQAAMRMNGDNESKIEKKRQLVHRRLGHPGRKRFNNCVRDLDMDELTLSKRDELLDDSCETCIKAKQVKFQSHIPVPRARRPLQRVYMDFWGPNREGIGDERYYLSLIDDCTRYSWVFVKPDRKLDGIIYSLDGWLRRVERQSGKMLLIIRTDNAKEFLALGKWADAIGIELEFIESDTPPQNGVAERYNRFILEIARALLIDGGISKLYWKYAIVTANYLRNRTSLVKGSERDSSDGKPKTPYELWYGHEPDLRNLRVWGCRVLYHQKQDSKLDSRVMEGTFLLYGKSDKQYLILPKGGTELKLVTNPIFREREVGYLTETSITSSTTTTAGSASLAPLVPIAVAPLASEPVERADSQEQRQERERQDRQHKSFESFGNSHQNQQSAGQADGIDMSQADRFDNGKAQQNSELDQNRTSDMIGQTKIVDLEGEHTESGDQAPRRSSRQRQQSSAMAESQQTEQVYGRKRKAEGEDGESDRPAQRLRANLARLAVDTELLLDGNREFEIAHAAREKAGIRIPKSYGEAINDPIYGSKWKEAIRNELSSLISFGTWRLKRRKEVDGTISSTRWVFDIKLGQDGRIDRFKARLVARGNEQSNNDFDETFAPVFRLDSLRILIAIAVQHGLIAHQLDAKNAFVGSDLDKPNCIEIPEGLQEFDSDAIGNSGELVLELLKSLYGLRQSANLWHRKVSGFLEKLGFKPTTADTSVFINGRGLIIAVYVDDIIIFGKNVKDIETVKTKLKELHPMTDSGPVKKLLGMRFTWQDNGIVRLDQQSYIEQILDEFGMGDCKPVSTPISPSVKLDDVNGSLLGRSDHKQFRRLIGRLTFLVIATRPDIAFAVNQLSQYLAEPRKLHLAAAKHVLRYIKGTISHGLTFSAKGRQGLCAYADSAYANSARSRSTTGFVICINSAPVTWSSRKQSITAQSSTEAEYIAISEAAKQAIWTRHFLYAIGKGSVYRHAPTTIYEDNQGAIKIADNPVNHPKTKHIAVRYHAIRDHVSNGEICLRHLPTEKMIADGLTKAANHTAQRQLVDGLKLA